MLKFIQINENKALLAATSLAQLFNNPGSKGSTVALVSEPYLAFGKPATLPLNTKHISSTEDPRAAIIYNKHLNLTPHS